MTRRATDNEKADHERDLKKHERKVAKQYRQVREDYTENVKLRIRLLNAMLRKLKGKS